MGGITFSSTAQPAPYQQDILVPVSDRGDIVV